MQIISYTKRWAKSSLSNNQLNVSKSSNYKLASFLYFVENCVFKILDENWEEIDDINWIIEEIKGVFIKRIESIISKILKQREKLWFSKIPFEEVRKLFAKNLIYLLQLFFWNYKDIIPDWAYKKDVFLIPWLWATNFQEERLDYNTHEIKNAYFNSFLEEAIRDVIVPKWKNWKDRIWNILNKINNWNTISNEEISKYTRLIKFCIKQFRIYWYEEEDLIQEWLEAIIYALNRYRWIWFASPETYLRTVVLNHFKDLRREMFALKRWWWEIQTVNMWEYDESIIDEFSLKTWELMTKEIDGDNWYIYWWYISPNSVFDSLDNFTWKRKDNPPEGTWKNIEHKYWEDLEYDEIPF